MNFFDWLEFLSLHSESLSIMKQLTELKEKVKNKRGTTNPNPNWPGPLKARASFLEESRQIVASHSEHYVAVRTQFCICESPEDLCKAESESSSDHGVKKPEVYFVVGMFHSVAWSKYKIQVIAWEQGKAEGMRRV